MPGRLRVMTVVGTRPEIIRLSRIMAELDRATDHTLVHTGQNYDVELNEVFFRELGIRRPDYYLAVETSSLGATLGDVLRGTERAINQVEPDALVVLGDTNSCISALMARRMKVPVYHLEAGNRSFDPNVPEEINRHLVDHVSDYNLAYTEHSRRSLLAEGLHPSRVAVIGSPMKEVLDAHADAIAASTALERLGLERDGYLVASTHREENVDDRHRLIQVLDALDAVARDQDVPVILSAHPRTRRRISEMGLHVSPLIRAHPPIGFLDYVRLQVNARCVLSDSGTVSEESAILGFPAVTLRDAIERPEAIDAGAIVVTGLEPSDVVDSVRLVLDQHKRGGRPSVPAEYKVADTSRRVVSLIRSTATTHDSRAGVRRGR